MTTNRESNKIYVHSGDVIFALGNCSCLAKPLTKIRKERDVNL